MGRQPEYQGNRYEIRCLECADGPSPAGDFLASLTTAHECRIRPLLEMLADHGHCQNEEHFRKIDERTGIYHINNQDVHLLGFFEGGVLFLLAGWIDSRRKPPRAVIEEANEYRERFLSS
jgi:hypothetical protein